METLETLGITSRKQLKKFYSQWSVNASKKIKKYAQDHSLTWFNTKWRTKSKEIPFYIRTTAPKGFTGNIWFASSPVNYTFGKGVQKLSDKYKPFPKRFKVKPVRANGRWFTPKRYKPDVKDLDSRLAEVQGFDRFFVSKTSHGKSHKYKRPMLWGQDKSTRAVLPILLKEQMGDFIIQDPELERMIMEAFEETVASKRYL